MVVGRLVFLRFAHLGLDHIDFRLGVGHGCVYRFRGCVGVDELDTFVAENMAVKTMADG